MNTNSKDISKELLVTLVLSTAIIYGLVQKAFSLNHHGVQLSWVMHDNPHYPIGNDFRILYMNAEAWRNGLNPYLVERPGYIPNVYPPINFLLYFPLTFLPVEVAYRVWLWFNVFLGVLSVYLLGTLIKSTSYKRLFWLFSIYLISLSPGLWLYMERGQSGLLIFALLISSLALIHRREYQISAILIGLAGAIKVYGIIFILIYLPLRGFRLSIKSILLGLSTYALTFLAFSQYWNDFLRTITKFGASDGIHGYCINAALSVTACMPNNFLRYMVIFLFGVMTILLLFKKSILIKEPSFSQDLLLWFSYLSCLALFIPTTTISYNICFWILPLATFFSQIERNLNRRVAILIVIYFVILFTFSPAVLPPNTLPLNRGLLRRTFLPIVELIGYSYICMYMLKPSLFITKDVEPMTDTQQILS